MVEAKTELDRVLSLVPSMSLALYTRGVGAPQGRPAGGRGARFRDALARDPADAEAEHGLGHVRLEERRIREAEQHFRRAVTVWPEFADGWNSLATARASAGDELCSGTSAGLTPACALTHRRLQSAPSRRARSTSPDPLA